MSSARRDRRSREQRPLLAHGPARGRLRHRAGTCRDLPRVRHLPTAHGHALRGRHARKIPRSGRLARRTRRVTARTQFVARMRQGAQARHTDASPSSETVCPCACGARSRTPRRNCPASSTVSPGTTCGLAPLAPAATDAERNARSSTQCRRRQLPSRAFPCTARWRTCRPGMSERDVSLELGVAVTRLGASERASANDRRPRTFNGAQARTPRRTPRAAASPSKRWRRRRPPRLRRPARPRHPGRRHPSRPRPSRRTHAGAGGTPPA